VDRRIICLGDIWGSKGKRSHASNLSRRQSASGLVSSFWRLDGNKHWRDRQGIGRVAGRRRRIGVRKWRDGTYTDSKNQMEAQLSLYFGSQPGRSAKSRCRRAGGGVWVRVLEAIKEERRVRATTNRAEIIRRANTRSMHLLTPGIAPES
jgi:hypothetical protein